jgi:hypothetical protein
MGAMHHLRGDCRQHLMHHALRLNVHDVATQMHVPGNVVTLHVTNMLHDKAAAHLALYQACEWQVVEQVCEVLPHVCVAVLAQALIVEAVPANATASATAAAA